MNLFFRFVNRSKGTLEVPIVLPDLLVEAVKDCPVVRLYFMSYGHDRTAVVVQQGEDVYLQLSVTELEYIEILAGKHDDQIGIVFYPLSDELHRLV